jgi:hypothetical protein
MKRILKLLDLIGCREVSNLDKPEELVWLRSSGFSVTTWFGCYIITVLKRWLWELAEWFKW